MYHTELAAARRKAAELANQMQLSYAAAGKLEGDAKVKQCQLGADLAIKLSEARVEETRLTEAQSSYDANMKMAREYTEVEASKHPSPTHPDGGSNGNGERARIDAAMAKAGRLFFSAGPGAFRKAFLDAGGPETALAGMVAGDGTRGGILVADRWLPYREPGTAGVVMRDLVAVEPSDGPLVLPSSTDLEPSDSDWTRETHTVDGASTTHVPTPGSRIEQHDWNPKKVPITQALLLNRSANVESLVMRALFRLSEKSIEKVITTGNGAGRPEGFMPAMTSTYQVASQVAGGFSWEGMLNFVMSVPEEFSANNNIVGRRLTYANIMAVKDPAGQYVFALSALAAPNTILGVPFKANQYMPVVAADALALVVGSFKEAYTFSFNPAAERVMRFDDSNFAPGAGFAITNLVGGKCHTPNALRALKLAVTV